MNKCIALAGDLIKQHCTYFDLHLKALTHTSIFVQRDEYLGNPNLIKSFFSFRADMSRDKNI